MCAVSVVSVVLCGVAGVLLIHSPNLCGRVPSSPTDTNDAAAMVRTVVAQLREMDLAVDGVTSFDEYGVYPAARLAEFLGLRPCPAPSTRGCASVPSRGLGPSFRGVAGW